MTVKYANKGSGLGSIIPSIIAMAAAPFTAGTSLAWLPGAIGAVNGIVRGDPVGAIAGGLGVLGATGGLNGILGQAAKPVSEAAGTIKEEGGALANAANEAAKTTSNITNASKGFNTTDMLKLGTLALGSGNKQQTMVAGGGQQPMTNGTNYLQTYANSLSKKANGFA